jgi:hypothetical protein
VHGIPLVQTLLVHGIISEQTLPVHGTSNPQGVIMPANPQGVRILELDSLGDAHQADFQALPVYRMPEDPQEVRIPKTRVTNKDFS